MIIAFLQSEGKSPDIQIVLKIFKSTIIKERIFVIVLKVDNVFHLVLQKYHGLYVEHPATLGQRKACCILQYFQMKR